MAGVLQNRRVLITGATAGIGRGIARACTDAGASVVIADINIEGAKKVAVELGDSAQAVALDVCDLQQIHQLFEELQGPLDGLVNNAGITVETDFLEFPEEDLDRLWQTNLRSVFCLCQQAGRRMKESGGGVIVNMSSVHGNASTPGYEMYAAVKAGVSAMTRAISWSLGGYGIRVNTLSPGLTQTEAVAKVLEEKPHLAEPFKTMHASGRYATVEEIGQAAVYLLSDGAAAITGAEIIADHGASALLVRSEELK